jgi:succinate dehydrogenase / fumarate reductase membrane anchor subunit
MDFDQARAWVAHPLVALLLIIFVSALFYHAKLGLQVIIEDYVSDISGRQAFIKIFNLICWMAGLVAIASILRIALGS